jgi:hypothetical protein
MEFGGNFQELVRFELEAPVYTWMAFQLMKGAWKIQICEFMGLLREFDLKFLLGLLRIELINGFDHGLRP